MGSRLPEPLRRKEETLLFPSQTSCCSSQERESVGRGDGADWAITRRGGVGVTGIGAVEALRSKCKVDAEGVRSGSGSPSAGLEVGARVLGASGLGVWAVELVILSC